MSPTEELDEQVVYLSPDHLKQLPVTIPANIMVALLGAKASGACVALVAYIAFLTQQTGAPAFVRMAEIKHALQVSFPMLQIAKQELLALGVLRESNARDKNKRFVGKVLSLCLSGGIEPSIGFRGRRQNPVDGKNMGDREYTYTTYIYSPNIYNNPNHCPPFRGDITRGLQRGAKAAQKPQRTQEGILAEEDLPKKQNEFLDLANKLYQIIRSKKNINISSKQLQSWSVDIRKLHTINKINPQRISRVLDWYAENIGGQYIPVVESGISLRNKFSKLEDAIKREKQGASGSLPGLPEDLLAKLTPILPLSIDCILSNKLYNLSKQWAEAEALAKEKNALQRLPTLLNLLERYVALLSSSKITPEPHVFATTHWCFRKLLKELNASMGYDVLTGKRI